MFVCYKIWKMNFLLVWFILLEKWKKRYAEAVLAFTKSFSHTFILHLSLSDSATHLSSFYKKKKKFTPSPNNISSEAM